MIDSPPDPTADADRRPGTPRWVKVFGLIATGAVALVVVVMLIGGGQHGPGMHAPSGGTGGQTPIATGQASAGGVGAPADSDQASRTIAVATLDTMTFEPSSIEVAAGEAVTFVVTNSGQAVHEFTLGDAAMQEEHADAMAHMPDGMAHDLPNSVTLQPGETKRLTWRFAGSGTFEYACHEPGHYEAGMRGQITVG